MQPALGREKEAAELSKARSPLVSEVEKVLKEAREKIRLEARTAIFEKGHKLKADDLKIPIDPEEFTKQEIIEKVFRTLRVEFSKERHFKWLKELRKADYEGNFGTTKFLVEAKPLNLDLKEGSGAAVEQVKELFRLSDVKENYTFGIATDGLQWIFIDREGKEIIECSLLKDFPAIEALITGKKPAKAPKREAEISRRFYKWYNALLHGGSYHDLEGERRSISEEDCLVRNIANVQDEEEGEEIAQVLVDRMIFIKFLQVKGLIKEDLLAHLATLGEDILNSKLKQLFFNVLNTEEGKRPDVDPKFREVPYLNGSLFVKIRAEEKNSDYLVKAEILKKVIEFLGAFRFVSKGEAVEEFLDPEILGYLFERAMTATDRKGTGAYYTPKTITRYICENTIYPYTLEGARAFLKAKKGYREEELPKTFDDLLRVGGLTLSDIYAEIIQKVTVLDPACGSGAFLYQAGNVLLEICKRVEEVLGLRNSELALKKIILKSSLYGVDINRKAVEIAKLRLWLWMAESYNPEQRPEPLPNIEYNIRAGNSLVGYIDISAFREAKVSMDDYLGVETPVMDLIKERDDLLKDYKASSGEKAQGLKKRLQELDEKIKRKLDIHLFQEMQGKKIPVSPTEFTKLDPFHWGFDFHKVFENGKRGFSVVIGNPPYVRIQTMKKEKPWEVEIYKQRYAAARAGNYDVYVVFVEKSLALLDEHGRQGFILPNKFFSTDYGRALRQLITERKALAQIVDFGPAQVFEGATTYTCLLFLSGSPSEYVSYAKVVRPSELTVTHPIPLKVIENKSFTAEPWVFAAGTEKNLVKKITRNSLPLGNLAQIGRGSSSGADHVFILHREGKSLITRQGERVEIELDILRVPIYATDFGHYSFSPQSDEVIIFPYNVAENSYALKPESEMRQSFPKAYKYLISRKSELEARKQFQAWHGFSAPRNLDVHDAAQILVPLLADKALFCHLPENRKSFCLMASGGFSITVRSEKRLSPNYVLGILNSRLLFWRLRSISNIFRAGWITCTKQYIKTLPIRTINFSDPADKARHDRMVALVEKMLELHKQLAVAKTQADSEQYQSQIDVTDKEIDALVYELYGLTEEEIKVVEGSV